MDSFSNPTSSSGEDASSNDGNQSHVPQSTASSSPVQQPSMPVTVAASDAGSSAHGNSTHAVQQANMPVTVAASGAGSSAHGNSSHASSSQQNANGGFMIHGENPTNFMLFPPGSVVSLPVPHGAVSLPAPSMACSLEAQSCGVSSSSTSSSMNMTSTSSKTAKRERVKDEAYWEKRRKNNESAKRSRQNRKRKAGEIEVMQLQLQEHIYRLIGCNNTLMQIIANMEAAIFGGRRCPDTSDYKVTHQMLAQSNQDLQEALQQLLRKDEAELKKQQKMDYNNIPAHQNHFRGPPPPPPPPPAAGATAV